MLDFKLYWNRFKEKRNQEKLIKNISLKGLVHEIKPKDLKPSPRMRA